MKRLKSYLSKAAKMNKQNFKKLSDSFIIDAEYEEGFREIGLTSIDGVFDFSGGKDLSKRNLASYRSRIEFEINPPKRTVFLKRFNRPPIAVQLKNWLAAYGRRSCASFDFEVAGELSSKGIKTAKPVCFGEQFGVLFEKRSFCVTEKIADAESLERRLPDCFFGEPDSEKRKLKKGFIKRLGEFARKFHKTGYRHRDFYFSHIFYNDRGEFFLIDLARAFKPLILDERYRIKDIAQLYYSAPGKYFSKTDRLRFYLSLTGKEHLSSKDKGFLKKVIKKTKRMMRHNRRHGREVPFENQGTRFADEAEL